MKICLIEASNPRGKSNDSYVDFRNYNSYEDSRWRSWHSIPCSLGTEFFSYNGENFHECYKYDGFIVLFNDNPEALIPFVNKLKLMGKKVFCGYHESFDDLMLKCSHDMSWFHDANKLISHCHSYLNVCPSFEKDINNIFNTSCVNTFHGAPFGKYDHLKKQHKDRNGILITTRSLNQRLRRNTLLSLFQAESYCKKNNTFFTFVSEDHDSVVESLPKFRNVKFIKGPLNYNSWLKLISEHKFVYGSDEAKTLGQVNLDAALVGVAGFGGNSENNKLTNSCIELDSVEYNREYSGQIKTLENLCSLQSISHNIKKAFDK